MLECPEESLEWISDGPQEPLPLEPFVRVSVKSSQLTARARGRKRFQWLEVDWDHDGSAFESLSRAARPWRAATPLPVLSHNVTRPGGYQIALRAADPAGRIYAAQLAVRVPSSEPSVRARRRRG
jgi:hypothetical protein